MSYVWIGSILICLIATLIGSFVENYLSKKHSIPSHSLYKK